MALDGVSWVRGGLVETALAARGLAVRQNRRRPLLPPSGHAPPWELVSASDLWWRRGYAGSNSAPCFSMAKMPPAPCASLIAWQLAAPAIEPRKSPIHGALARPVTVRMIPAVP